MKNILMLPFLAQLICNPSEQPVSLPKEDTVRSENIPPKKTAEASAPIRTKAYDSLSLTSVDVIKSSSGTKSVVFSKDMKNLYAMNLEGMSVMQFSQSSREITKIFKFKKTPGQGWDYATEKPISSYQEKPVEAFLSNHDSVLWVSLHNAGGIVPIHVFDHAAESRKRKQAGDRLVYVQNSKGQTTDSFYVPLVLTGKTPKVISCTSDDRYLLVSNWHSNTVSVLEIDAKTYPYAKLVRNVNVPDIPRGIAIDEKNKTTYIAIMGGSSLSVIDNSDWSYKGEIKVSSNPRHVVQGANSLLYVSFNKLGKVGCIDPSTGKTLFTASTASLPRTMVLSKDNRFLFVTCYSGNRMMVFKIHPDRFQLIGDFKCPGSPVGLDIYESNNMTEIWACSYAAGTISVYSFKKI